ncbi:UNVERIFIED_CONTAM: protein DETOXIFICATION 54 [Sesamum angustifolium]|uniref:Protein DETOXIFICATION 54 n=1 Tax=Sesamum angustifolium TaxID=2727405 RepID=A0AAW2LWB9_9LAMI
MTNSKPSLHQFCQSSACVSWATVHRRVRHPTWHSQAGGGRPHQSWVILLCGHSHSCRPSLLVSVGFTGLWLGLLSAQAACAVSILYVIFYCTNWEGEAVKASKLSSLEIGNKCESDEEEKGLLVMENGKKCDVV